LVNFTNTNIFGDLAELSTVSDTIKLDGSNVQYYGSVPRMGCKNIWWQNMQKPMVVSDLEFLVRDLYESSVRGGQLFIAGTNPNIEDEEILYFIFKLVHDEDWVVVYNGYYITAANRDNYLQSGTDDYLYTHNY